jgi:uncharacterized protein (TIGR01777 family)
VRVAVTGATGLIGGALVRELLARGDEISVLSRDAERARTVLGEVQAFAWPEPKAGPPPADALRGRDAVVNLLGEPLAQRWTKRAKAEMRDSRVLGTRNLVAALRELPEPELPRVLVSQSAVGWYGPRGDEPVDETQSGGDDFSAQVTAAWEVEASRAEELGLRVVRTRTGVVLAGDGGALEKMLPPFRLGLGGPVAGGRQYVSWVHVDDVAGAMAFCLDTEAARGAVNVAAPEPVTNRELSKALGRVLHRPAVLPLPGAALKLMYGEMATVVTTGARVVPRRLQELGYPFRQPELDEALRDVTGGG